MERGGRKGWASSRLERGPHSQVSREAVRASAGYSGPAAPAAHLWICAGGRVAFPTSAPGGREASGVLEDLGF